MGRMHEHVETLSVSHVQKGRLLNTTEVYRSFGNKTISEKQHLLNPSFVSNNETNDELKVVM